MATYPETYLHVVECRSGQEWIVPIPPDGSINLETQVDAWIASEMAGELQRDGEITRRMDGEYYGRVMTDGRPPTACVCWDGGGFYLTNQEG